MPYRYLEDVAIGDLAFEARAESLRELFQEAALALTSSMVDMASLRAVTEEVIRVEAMDEESLLHAFLSEIVFLKDAKRLLLKTVEVEIAKTDSGLRLRALGMGEQIDARRHQLGVDVKAVTYHGFRVISDAKGWSCTVVLDV